MLEVENMISRGRKQLAEDCDKPMRGSPVESSTDSPYWILSIWLNVFVTLVIEKVIVEGSRVLLLSQHCGTEKVVCFFSSSLLSQV